MSRSWGDMAAKSARVVSIFDLHVEPLDSSCSAVFIMTAHTSYTHAAFTEPRFADAPYLAWRAGVVAHTGRWNHQVWRWHRCQALAFPHNHCTQGILVKTHSPAEASCLSPGKQCLRHIPPVVDATMLQWRTEDAPIYICMHLMHVLPAHSSASLGIAGGAVTSSGPMHGPSPALHLSVHAAS